MVLILLWPLQFSHWNYVVFCIDGPVYAASIMLTFWLFLFLFRDVTKFYWFCWDLDTLFYRLLQFGVEGTLFLCLPLIPYSLFSMFYLLDFLIMHYSGSFISVTIVSILLFLFSNYDVRTLTWLVNLPFEWI